MGSPAGPLTRRRLIEGHVESMRKYADELTETAKTYPFISIAKVTERIHRCADQVEKSHSGIIEREKREKK